MTCPRSPEGIALVDLLDDLSLPAANMRSELSNLVVSGLQLDSRKLKPGDLFVAFPGLQSDGRNYLSEAEAAGAVAALVEREGFKSAHETFNFPVIGVDSLAQKVSAIAGRFYAEPSTHLRVIGITGTNGKTTCTQLLAQLLSQLGQPGGVIGTLGCRMLMDKRSGVKKELRETGLTTPDAVSVQCILADMQSQGASAVAIEVSSHSLDQGRVAGISFSTAVFTNLSQDHLDYHSTMSAYQQAKAQLFSAPGLQNAIVNVDDKAGRKIVAQLKSSAANVKIVSYSCQQQTADIYAVNHQFGPKGICASLHTPWGQGELRSSLQGEFNLSNLLAVIGAACVEGHALPLVLNAIEQLAPVPGRLEVVDTQAVPLIVVDYAHTSDALEKVLTALRLACKGCLWCVFGCGGDRDQGKRAMMGASAANFADRLVVTSDNPRGEDAEVIIEDILTGVPVGLNKAGPPEVIVDRRAAIRFAVAEAGEQDVVLIAGKGHEDYQLIRGQRLPFNDATEARLALRERAAL